MKNLGFLLVILFYSSSKLLADQLPDFQSITFDVKSYVVKPDNVTKQTLNRLYDFLVANPTYNVRLEGFCDARESSQEQELSLLSLQRATIIRDFLISKGIPKCRFVVLWRGSADPVAPHSTETQRRLNRRVQIAVFVNESNNLTFKHLSPEYEFLFDKTQEAIVFDHTNFQPYRMNQTIAFLKEALQKDADLIVVICGLEGMDFDLQSKIDFLKDSILQNINNQSVFFLPENCQNETILVRLFDKNCKEL